jgi:hypothetical protein
MKPSDVALFVDPFSARLGQDRLFDPGEAAGAGDNAFEPFVHLRAALQARGIEVHTADMLDSRRPSGRTVNVYISLGLRERYARLARRSDVRLSGFFAFECPIVLPALYGDLHRIGDRFKRVFSYSTEEALHPFLRGPVNLTRFMLPQSFDDVHRRIWERRDRQFIVAVNANKLTRLKVNELYTERLRAIEFFNRYDEIDLYGLGWDLPPGRIGTRLPRSATRLERRLRGAWESARPPADPLRVATREAWRGATSRKDLTLGGYKFAVCFENSILEGWITEKIFDCFYAGTVPIYLGAPDVERWIPPECFVDMRQFEGYEELREFLLTLTDDQIEAYRLAARDFLRSERFRPFSKQTFAELVGRLVEEDTGVPL